MPKKKEVKYKIYLIDPKTEDAFKVCDVQEKPFLVTTKEMQHVMGIWDTLKRLAKP